MNTNRLDCDSHKPQFDSGNGLAIPRILETGGVIVRTYREVETLGKRTAVGARGPRGQPFSYGFYWFGAGLP